MKKKLTLKLRHKIPLTIVFVSTLVELIYAVLRVVLTEDTVDSFDILCIASCTGMLLLMWIPLFTDRMFNRVIPPTMYTSFVVFCFCGLILGDVKNLYAHFTHWDSMLHFISGMLLAVLGFVLVNTLNDSKRAGISMSPFFVAAVAFCFVMTIQSLWEIGEFLCDEWFGTNSQTFLETTTGSLVTDEDVPLVGHEALRDTMSDFMLDGLGGLIVSSRKGKEVYYKAADTEQAQLLHHIIEQMIRIACPSDEEETGRSSGMSRQEELICTIHDQLTRHLDRRYTIEELSRQYLINTASLKKTFKEVYGLPIAAYMKEYRIQKAMELLEKTDESISVIAEKVGYETQGKFTNAFKDTVSCKSML